MNILDELKADVAALSIIKDWLGEGGLPVPPEQSSARALACAKGNDGFPCPNNIEAGWWDRNAKHPIAVEIIKQLEIKARLKIETPFDKDLHVCSVCRCCTVLKVHTPIKFIAEHTSGEMLGKFPVYCWVKKELT